MHDILRAQVEHLITERKEENWPEIKALAEQYDSVLYQSKRYKQQAKAMDTDSQTQQQWNDRSLIINATKQGHQTPTGKR
jgi:hypothetical protein